MAPFPQRAISERELSQLVAALAGRGLSWLDGGSGALGRYTHLAWGPSELRLARLGDGDPFAPLAEQAGPSFGDPLALRTAIAIAYDATWSAPARFGVRKPARLDRDRSALVCWARAHEASLRYDHQTGIASFGGRSRAAVERAIADVEEALRATGSEPTIAIEGLSASDPARHRSRIEQALSAIAAGDLYQVNLARPWHARWRGAPLALALAMRAASPVPLGAYLEGPEGQFLIARTMERFLSIAADRRIESRPIKGTIDDRHDAEAALLGSDKERAEHTMIVDLMRNDLGRVSVPGSVATPVLFAVEPYARLSHLVSHVTARLRDDASLTDVLWATFPPASISGAPKLSAVEHIEALEEAPRGFYTGALGSIAYDGSVSLAVAIRTAELTSSAPGRGTLRYFAGGGIVEASDPDREVAETELKARVFLDAVASLR